MWNPPIALTSEEQKIVARTRKTRKFFVFLREHRHELLDADFQHILAQSYSPESRCQEPVDAGLLALATLLQAYCHVGDRDAVELTVMDKRWQLVLDCLGAEHPEWSKNSKHALYRRFDLCYHWHDPPWWLHAFPPYQASLSPWSNDCVCSSSPRMRGTVAISVWEKSWPLNSSGWPVALHSA